MFWKKRGISPLIATVLIIGFTVALAAVIMVWGQGFIKGMQEKTETGANTQLVCAQDVVMQVSNVCRDTPSTLKVTIKNDGNKALRKIVLRAYETDSSIGTANLAPILPAIETIDAFGVKTFNQAAASFAPFATTANVRQVEAIPIVSIEGKDTQCAQSGSKFPLGSLPASAADILAC